MQVLSQTNLSRIGMAVLRWSLPALVLVAAAGVAWGICQTIPERRAALCPDGDCIMGEVIPAVVTIDVDDVAGTGTIVVTDLQETWRVEHTVHADADGCLCLADHCAPPLSCVTEQRLHLGLAWRQVVWQTGAGGEINRRIAEVTGMTGTPVVTVVDRSDWVRSDGTSSDALPTVLAMQVAIQEVTP